MSYIPLLRVTERLLIRGKATTVDLRMTPPPTLPSRLVAKQRHERVESFLVIAYPPVLEQAAITYYACYLLSGIGLCDILSDANNTALSTSQLDKH